DLTRLLASQVEYSLCFPRSKIWEQRCFDAFFNCGSRNSDNFAEQFRRAICDDEESEIIHPSHIYGTCDVLAVSRVNTRRSSEPRIVPRQPDTDFLGLECRPQALEDACEKKGKQKVSKIVPWACPAGRAGLANTRLILDICSEMWEHTFVKSKGIKDTVEMPLSNMTTMDKRTSYPVESFTQVNKYQRRCTMHSLAYCRTDEYGTKRIALGGRAFTFPDLVKGLGEAIKDVRGKKVIVSMNINRPRTKCNRKIGAGVKSNSEMIDTLLSKINIKQNPGEAHVKEGPVWQQEYVDGAHN
ncbi:unnamed protein product, partial [Symbiodinium necroappetens]